MLFLVGKLRLGVMWSRLWGQLQSPLEQTGPSHTKTSGEGPGGLCLFCGSLKISRGSSLWPWICKRSLQAQRSSLRFLKQTTALGHFLPCLLFLLFLFVPQVGLELIVIFYVSASQVVVLTTPNIGTLSFVVPSSRKSLSFHHYFLFYSSGTSSNSTSLWRFLSSMSRHQWASPSHPSEAALLWHLLPPPLTSPALQTLHSKGWGSSLSVQFQGPVKREDNRGKSVEEML